MAALWQWGNKSIEATYQKKKTSPLKLVIFGAIKLERGIKQRGKGQTHWPLYKKEETFASIEIPGESTILDQSNQIK